MFVDEILVDVSTLDDVIGDVVENGEIRLRLENHGNVGKLEASVLEGGQHRHLYVGCAQSSIGQASPQDGMHLRHVGAPQDECIGMLEIVVAAHGLVHSKGAHETPNRGSHAMTGIGVDVV